MTKDITTVDQYIAAAPAERQVILRTVRQTIKAVLPEAVEKISYQMPTYHQEETIVHFACPNSISAFILRLLRSRPSKRLYNPTRLVKVRSSSLLRNRSLMN